MIPSHRRQKSSNLTTVRTYVRTAVLNVLYGATGEEESVKVSNTTVSLYLLQRG